MAVEEPGGYLSKNGESIKAKLRKRKYKPQPVRRVEIPKPDGGIRNLGVLTREDARILPRLHEITDRFNICFHYTITAYEKDIEPGVPSIEESMETLCRMVIDGRGSVYCPDSEETKVVLSLSNGRRMTAAVPIPGVLS